MSTNVNPAETLFYSFAEEGLIWMKLRWRSRPTQRSPPSSATKWGELGLHSRSPAAWSRTRTFRTGVIASVSWASNGTSLVFAIAAFSLNLSWRFEVPTGEAADHRSFQASRICRTDSGAVGAVGLADPSLV
ncbi:hypothetical protein [Mesorhizobium sp. LjNodule214]|uniref:hypothetical protein n=1 Tax=Mesorhizobium sp. LjNodule214 TaxID=3342252 RepID=UPI003ED0A039